jgi:hypothetical protein
MDNLSAIFRALQTNLRVTLQAQTISATKARPSKRKPTGPKPKSRASYSA